MRAVLEFKGGGGGEGFGEGEGAEGCVWREGEGIGWREVGETGEV